MCDNKIECDRCSSNRVALITCHGRDCSGFYLDSDGLISEDTYLPEIDDICGGDDVHVEICMECGKTQGDFPKNKEHLKKAAENI